jgi:hypothetical protein
MTILTKIILIVAVLAVFAGGITQTNNVYATGAYQRGFSDAVCDASNCHGHGYDASCPSASDHSTDFCTNYGAGYSAGWNSASNNNGNSGDTNSQASAIDGNNIKGSHNTVNQQIINVNRHNSDNSASNDNNDHNHNDGSGVDSSGQLPRCKVFCLGVQ